MLRADDFYLQFPSGSEVLNNHPLIVEDITVVYARSNNRGGSVLFNMKANGGGSGGETITFREC